MYVNVKEKNRIFLKSIFFFLFYYDIALNRLGTLFSTRKILTLFFIFYYVYKYDRSGCNRNFLAGRNIKNIYVLEILISALSIVWVFSRLYVHDLFNATSPEYSYPTFFVAYALIAPLFIGCFFENIQEFMKVLALVNIYQAIFVIVEYKFMPLKQWLANNIYTTSNISYLSTSRATGLGASGADLSVRLFWGVFALGFLIINKDRNTLKYWLGIFIICFAQILCGRTGLYVGIVIIFIVILEINKNRDRLTRNIIKGIFALFMTAIVMIYVIAIEGNVISNFDTTPYTEVIDRNTNSQRIIGENGFLGIFLGQMEAPGLSYDTLWGYGITRGDLGDGNIASHDSGYVKRYVADGLIWTAFEYLILFVLLVKLCQRVQDRKWRRYLRWMIPILFLTEIKEPFVYYYIHVATIIIVYYLAKDIEVKQNEIEMERKERFIY